MTLLHLSSLLNGLQLIHPQSPRLSSISPVSSVSLPSTPHQTQFQSLVLCAARRRKKRAGQGISARFLFKSLSLLSTNLQILPQPLDLIIADLGGGVDGGGGGGGGGGRGWGRFDGWRRKRNRVPVLILVCVMLWICGYCKVSGKVIIKSDEILKVLGACLLGGVSVVKGLKRGLKREARSLVFVFLCLVASLVFGFKKESFVMLASQVRSCSSSALLTKRRSRRRV